jgi:hypothetical protein
LWNPYGERQTATLESTSFQIVSIVGGNLNTGTSLRTKNRIVYSPLFGTGNLFVLATVIAVILFIIAIILYFKLKKKNQ